MTRLAIVDIGTNSTRLLVAEVTDGSVAELDRRSAVTRMGRGVDTSGKLSAEAIEDVCATVAEYIDAYRALAADRVVAIATSAVRDAENSAAFMAELRERFALDARILNGTEEAWLTYLGACADRPSIDNALVIDIGGGSTELVIGSDDEVAFHASLQAGTVRHTERHLLDDPPSTEQLETLSADVRSLLDAELSGEAIAHASKGIAVAGTPTSLAAIDQELDPYNPELVHGYRLSLESIQRMLSMLAARPLEERLQGTGLHPGRAPTIVAGGVILIQGMRAFGLTEIE